MRLIRNILSAALLVGCLITAVAVVEADLLMEYAEYWCGSPYKKLTPTHEELATIFDNHRAWLESGKEPNDERRANLCEATLEHANFQGARLEGANFQHASLSWANFQGAYLGKANFQHAYLREANFQQAFMKEANLSEANLDRANLQGAFLAFVNLARAIYEPNPESLPVLTSLTVAVNLEQLVFHHTPAALITLREALKKGGMRTQERQLTYAIEHTRRLHAWNPRWYTLSLTDTRPWLEKLTGKSESLFSYVLFELPSAYGMAPGRALWGLIGLIPIFSVPYWLAIKRTNRRSGIWMIVPADRIAPGRGQEKIVRIRPQTAKTWRERLRGEWRLFRIGLYFSLLSAFHLGWRELNVGTWIARLQSREYTLRATGWVRTVAGIQSLLSVYLLALWVLTYFGRPFE